MKERLEKLLEQCLNELERAHNGSIEPDKAERNAALCLELQIRLSDYLASAELKAKTVKNETERLVSQKYFEYKNNGIGDKKMTEAALEHAVAKDEEVFKMKEEMIKQEAEYKKWNYIINILSNSHIFYRNLTKKEFGG